MPDLKALVEQAVRYFSPGTLDTYLELYHPDATLHFLPPGLPPGREGGRVFFRGFLSAFPDARVTIQDMFVEGDKLACRFTVTGTHQGEFMGVAATGKPVSISMITILRFEGSQCVERWNEGNFLGLMQQLGALPVPA